MSFSTAMMFSFSHLPYKTAGRIYESHQCLSSQIWELHSSFIVIVSRMEANRYLPVLRARFFNKNAKNLLANQISILNRTLVQLECFNHYVSHTRGQIWYPCRYDTHSSTVTGNTLKIWYHIRRYIKGPNIYLDCPICKNQAISPGLSDAVLLTWQQRGMNDLSTLYVDGIFASLPNFRVYEFTIFLCLISSRIFKYVNSQEIIYATIRIYLWHHQQI